MTIEIISKEEFLKMSKMLFSHPPNFSSEKEKAFWSTAENSLNFLCPKIPYRNFLVLKNSKTRSGIYSRVLDKNKKPNQERVWDSIAKSIGKRDFFKIREIKAISEFLKDKKGLVIDLGCGAGWNMIPNKEIIYYGIDFSNESIKLAKKRAEKISIKARLFKGNISRLDKKLFKDEMFDYGLFVAALHCIETPEERLNALKEFYRVLKKGGEGLITVWNSEDKRFNGIKGDIYMSWKEGKESFMRYYYLYSKEELLDLLKSVGFKILEIYTNESDRFSKKNWIIKIRK